MKVSMDTPAWTLQHGHSSVDTPTGLAMRLIGPRGMTSWDWDPHRKHWVGRPGLGLLSQRCRGGSGWDGRSSGELGQSTTSPYLALFIC